MRLLGVCLFVFCVSASLLCVCLLFFVLVVLVSEFYDVCVYVHVKHSCGCLGVCFFKDLCV